MRKIILHFAAITAVFLLTTLVGFSQPNAWINELHYDNAGTDAGEFIEVVIENAGSYSLADFQVDLYNGNGGVTYDTKALSLFTVGATSGNYTFYTYGYPANGIQNGAPDGMALSYQSILIPGQYLSYEGTILATNGPANGLTSVDIGVLEAGGDPIGLSLQLTGTGAQYNHFTWLSPATATSGGLNNGQAFGAAATPTKLAITSIFNGNPPIVGVPFDVVVQAQDNSNNPASVTTTTNVTLTLASGTGSLGGTLTGAILIGTSSVTISGVTYNTGETGVSITASDNASGLNPGTSSLFAVIAPTNVSTISALRAGTVGQLYKLTGQAVLTFQQTFRNQKYIQDATAAILIDDVTGVITTAYNLGDGITGITGTLDIFNDMTQFIPFTNPGAPTSTGNVITPQVITLDDLLDSFDDYESELVKINGVTFTDAGANFAVGTIYPISDGSKALFNFRTTFYDANYIGTAVPTTANIVVIPNARIDGNFITSRSLADIQGISNPATKLAVTSVNGGVNPFANYDFSVVVQAQDASGNPAYVSNNVNITLTTNGGTSGTVAFVGGTTTTGVILIGTNEVTLTGVQMAPIGTNVTITATDNSLVGNLSPGTSLPFNVVELFIPEVIITEVMQNPLAVLDNLGEWFEVYNRSASPIDMNGWIIKDNDGESHTITGSLIVPPNDFIVLGNNADNLTNGGYVCDYVYTGFQLANSADEIVITLADGVTEIDRVEWLSGWPAPNGSSMVFTGFPTENNNVGTAWVYSTFRESSFDATLTDKGSPGSNGYDQIMTGGFKLNLKVFLEAPYISPSSMSNYYRAEGLLPLTQPFNPTLPYYGNNTPKWLYAGTQTVGFLPLLTTDWLLIELRDAATPGGAGSGTVKGRYPALVSSDGTVTSLNGYEPLNITTSFTNKMYIVVWSINHLGVMSSTGITPVAGSTVSYDFSTGSAQVYGGTAGYKQLETGVWGLMSGDINGDKTVSLLDKSAGWATEAGEEAAYQGTNLFLDNQIDNKDKNSYWVPNFGKTSSVPN